MGDPRVRLTCTRPGHPDRSLVAVHADSSQVLQFFQVMGPPHSRSTLHNPAAVDNMSSSLLDHIRTRLTLDVDSMDPHVAARHVAPSHKFCDMTSNQAIVYAESIRPERADLFRTACTHIRSTELQLDMNTQVADTLDLLTVLLAKSVYPYLTGRVHAQTSPSTAYDTEATINHAKKLVAVFEANGIPKSRVCIKIPATPQSLIACRYLERLGIRTLATCLFSLPQAMAAHQAGCLYVAPYFNELRVHFDPSTWKEYADTAKDHPTSCVIRSILRLYQEIGSSTLVMPASIVTAKEVIALVSLKPDHLTLSGSVLDQLAAAQVADINDTPVQVDGDILDAVKNVDYLENNANVLQEALAADPESSRKLADALKIFGEREELTKELIRAVFAAA